MSRNFSEKETGKPRQRTAMEYGDKPSLPRVQQGRQVLITSEVRMCG